MHLTAPAALASAALVCAALAPASAAATATGSAATPIALSQLTVDRSQAGLPITARVSLRPTAATSLKVSTVQVSATSPTGTRYAFPDGRETTVTTSTSTTPVTTARTLPQGTYSTTVRVLVGSAWYTLTGPTLTVWGVAGKSLRYPAVAANAAYPMTGQFPTGSWTMASTSAYPGTITRSQTNPGDHKADCINPAWSRPQPDGWFAASRRPAGNTTDGCGSSGWYTDLATTRRPDLGGLTLVPGDSVSATVTLRKIAGSWPAIWTWTDNGTANAGTGHGEVDLLEYHGDSADNTLEMTNWAAAGGPHCWVHQAMTPDKPFRLRVDLSTSATTYFIDGRQVCRLAGVPASWRAHLIISQSVDLGRPADVASGYHSAPLSTTSSFLGMRVTDLSVWH